jgi:hypothetical protein
VARQAYKGRLTSTPNVSTAPEPYHPIFGWQLDTADIGRSSRVIPGSSLLGGGLTNLPHAKELEHIRSGSTDSGRRGGPFDFFQECSEREVSPDRYSRASEPKHRKQPRTMIHAAPFVSNPPLSAVVDTIKDLGVNQHHAGVQETAQSQGNLASGGFATLFRVLVRWCRPELRQSYSRLEWHCSCGQQFWGDFKNDEPEELHRLVLELQQHGFVVDTTLKTTTTPGTSSTTGATSSSQNTATSASNSSPNSSPSTSTAVKQGVSATPSDTASPAARQTTVSMPLPLSSIGKPVYLELCINRSSSVTQLGEIIIVDGRNQRLIKTDLELFGKYAFRS